MPSPHAPTPELPVVVHRGTTYVSVPALLELIDNQVGVLEGDWPAMAEYLREFASGMSEAGLPPESAQTG